MNNYFRHTRRLLKDYPRGKKIEAYAIIDTLIDKLNLTTDAEDVAISILRSLERMNYLEYHEELFAANYIIIKEP
jgi:hypothetical protein